MPPRCKATEPLPTHIESVFEVRMLVPAGLQLSYRAGDIFHAIKESLDNEGLGYVEAITLEVTQIRESPGVVKFTPFE